MLTYVIDNIFLSPALVITNPVNTVGVMGKGLAAQFRAHYPEMDQQYRELCERGAFNTGQLWLYKTPHKWVLNFPTKAHWRNPSKLEYVESGLRKFIETYAEKGMTSVSFPLLGAGLGGLDWEAEVRPLMEDMLGPLPINTYVHLYDPNDTLVSAAPEPEALKQWLHQPPGSIPFERFQQDLIGLVQGQQAFTRLADASPFQAHYDAEESHITLWDAQAPLTTLSTSLLADLWHYLRTAGYAQPDHFPARLDHHTETLISLLAHLDYLQPVTLQAVNGPRQIGLRYTPPPLNPEDVDHAEIHP